VYASSPAAGRVTKFSAALAPVAALDAGDRPHAFHVPFATRSDHRNGSVRRAGQGSGILLEDWTDQSGLRLLKLGVEVKELTVDAAAGLRADFVTTDRAGLSAEVLDATGRGVQRPDLGQRSAGRQSVEIPAAAGLAGGAATMRVVAASTYADQPAGRAEAGFEWSGPQVAPLTAGILGVEPNPARGAASVRFAVPAGEVREFSLRVHDVSGRLVRTIDSGQATAGVHARAWDGRDDAGRPVSAGVYLVRLAVGDFTTTRKAVLLR
jgi:hypothetical protein